jgi:hypothetical protein
VRRGGVVWQFHLEEPGRKQHLVASRDGLRRLVEGRLAVVVEEPLQDSGYPKSQRVAGE